MQIKDMKIECAGHSLVYKYNVLAHVASKMDNI
jgi:hypothetical protein